MSLSQNLFLQSRQYLPAVLKNTPSRGWFIEYYVLHPQTNEMVRFRLKMNRERKRFHLLNDFKRYANNIANDINIHF